VFVLDSGDPQVTPEMVKTATSRAVAVSTSCKFQVPISTCIRAINANIPFKLVAAAEFYPQDIFNALQQINQRLGVMEQRLGDMDNSLHNIDDHVKIGLAQTANLRIVSRNTRLQAPLQLLPLQKTVSGVQLLRS
jgi:hypothetical protein